MGNYVMKFVITVILTVITVSTLSIYICYHHSRISYSMRKFANSCCDKMYEASLKKYEDSYYCPRWADEQKYNESRLPPVIFGNKEDFD